MPWRAVEISTDRIAAFVINMNIVHVKLGCNTYIILYGTVDYWIVKMKRSTFCEKPVEKIDNNFVCHFINIYVGKIPVKHIYFVAETKGSLTSMDLRSLEQSKIECARKFFIELAEKQNDPSIKYEVVDNYESLLDLVS